MKCQKYQIVVAGEPSNCPTKWGLKDSVHTVKSRKPIEAGEPAANYRGQIKCIFDCYSSMTGPDCSDIECNIGEIITVKRIE